MGYNLGKAQWKGPEQVTKILVALQFGIHVIGLGSCIPQDSRDKFSRHFPGENPEEKFKQYHSSWLTQLHDQASWNQLNEEEWEKAEKVEIDVLIAKRDSKRQSHLQE